MIFQKKKKYCYKHLKGGPNVITAWYQRYISVYMILGLYDKHIYILLILFWIICQNSITFNNPNIII